VDAIRYLDRTGCQWDALPADFPHPKLVYHYFKTWTADGTLNRMHNHLREQVRQQCDDRDAQPTAALLDSQSVRSAETVARSSRGYDAGKKVNGRKRHIAVDTCGLLLAIRRWPTPEQAHQSATTTPDAATAVPPPDYSALPSLPTDRTKPSIHEHDAASVNPRSPTLNLTVRNFRRCRCTGDRRTVKPIRHPVTQCRPKGSRKGSNSPARHGYALWMCMQPWRRRLPSDPGAYAGPRPVSRRA
jgi:transposase